MQRIPSIFLTLAAALASLAGGCQMSGSTAPAATQPAATQPAATQPYAAVDLHNTVCPVSGQSVGNSKYTAVYDGKIYHLCCSDCPADFKKDPQKYANAVAADPAKYGVK